MNQRNLIARRYAAAFLSFAKDKEVGQLVTDLKILQGIYFEPLLRSALLNPSLSQKNQSEIFAKIATLLKLESLTTRFMATLIEEGRVEFLREVTNALEELFDKKQGRLQGVLKAAVMPSAEIIRGVEDSMTKILGQDIKLTPEKDESLLAGMRIELKGITLDTSLRHDLDQMAL